MFHGMPRSIAYEFVKLKFNSITRMNIKSLKVVNSESSFFLFPFLFLETFNAYQNRNNFRPKRVERDTLSRKTIFTRYAQIYARSTITYSSRVFFVRKPTTKL